ncbi:hypothetical protein [Streptomyces sp. NPDC001100]
MRYGFSVQLTPAPAEPPVRVITSQGKDACKDPKPVLCLYDDVNFNKSKAARI